MVRECFRVTQGNPTALHRRDIGRRAVPGSARGRSGRLRLTRAGLCPSALRSWVCVRAAGQWRNGDDTAFITTMRALASHGEAMAEGRDG